MGGPKKRHIDRGAETQTRKEGEGEEGEEEEQRHTLDGENQRHKQRRKGNE